MCALRLSTGIRNNLLQGTGGIAGLLNEGVMDIYTGTMPASADAAETGTLLVRVSVASGLAGSSGTGGGTAGTGVGTNGLKFGTAANGSITKSADVWSGTGKASGESGWWRFYATQVLKGATGTAIRMDGNCAVSGGDLNMSDLTVAAAATITIDTFSITLPAY